MQEQLTDPAADSILPYDVVTLPSQGIFYKDRKKSVKVSYYKICQIVIKKLF